MEGEKILLYREPDGTVYQVSRPPTSYRDVEDLAKELNIPPYVDTSLGILGRAIITIWTSTRLPESLGALAERRKVDGPITPLLIGGAAVKMLCPVANAPGSPMNRRIRDLDYVVTRGQSSRFVTLLSFLSEIAGTKYHHFLTSSDRRFNAIRAGSRYRIRSVDWTASLEPVVGWVDILVEKIPMRHEVDVREEFGRAKSNVYTIGPEKMIISKCQSIGEIDEKERELIEKTGQANRILDLPHYRHGKLVMGMEEKDTLDVCALLHDHADGENSMQLSELARTLSKDQKCLCTVRLNLERLIANADWLRTKGLSETQVSRVTQVAGEILRALPLVEKRWSRPWWNTDVEAPVIT